jgi:hypothetical protein
MPLRTKRVSMRRSWRPSQGLAMERLGPEPIEGKDVIIRSSSPALWYPLYNQSQALLYPANSDSVHCGSTPRRMRGATRPIKDRRRGEKRPAPVGAGLGVQVGRHVSAAPTTRRVVLGPPGSFAALPCVATEDTVVPFIPDGNVPAANGPKNIAAAVGAVIAGYGDGPGERHVAEDRRLHDRGAVHEPDADIAAFVAPDNVHAGR